MRLIISDRALHLNAKQQEEAVLIDLSTLRIANCRGCFGCWTKTPGKCVIRDDAPMVYTHIAQSDILIFVTRVCYGGYDTVMKRMLERSIPIQQAFLRLVDGETHHVQRAVVPKDATVIAYGAWGDEEKEAFQSLVARNAKNMCFARYRVCFCEEAQLETTLCREMQRWDRS